MSTWKKTQCNMCGVSCGLEMKVENNEIVSVRPDKDNPRSRNYCCRKGRAAKHYHKNKERIDYPLKLVNGEYVRISWEQANREIAEKTNAILKEHGPRAFGIIGGALSSSQSPLLVLKAILAGVGSQYLFNAVGIEFMGYFWSNGRIYGDQARAQKPDEHTDVYLMWGCNAYVTHNSAAARREIRELSENPSKKVVVIDPQVTESARMADLHIALRSGTDSLFLRALIAYILKENMQDQSFIDKWCKDMEEIRPWFHDFDIDEALRVCQVPRKEMEKLAHLLCENNWAVHQDLGVYCGRHSTLNSYLVLVLAAITGSLLVPHNNIVAEGYVNTVYKDERDPSVWRTKETNDFPVADVFPAGSLIPEILNDRDDRIRVMFNCMSNPARSYPNTTKMKEAFENLDLFVTDDICMTETTRLADYVLPATTAYEGYDFNIFQYNFPHVVCGLKHPVLKPEGERKEACEIWLDVADAMGLIPQLPQKLYDKAEQAVKENDRVPYAMELMKYLVSHKEHMKVATLIIGKTLGKAMGSVTVGMMYAAILTSPLRGTDKIARAGIKPNNNHPIMNKIPKLKDVCLMDEVFQQVLDKPEGLIIGTNNVDEDEYTKEHIRHKDKKFHLYCDEIDTYIQRVTPQKEEKELNQYPMVLSSGKHADAGVNNVMRNPITYVHRKPYSALMNPEDAKRMQLEDGQEVKVITKAGAIKVPVEYSYGNAKGYVVVPHQFGLEFESKTYGESANILTKEEEKDEITGNPFIRFIPCRIEKI